MPSLRPISPVNMLHHCMAFRIRPPPPPQEAMEPRSSHLRHSWPGAIGLQTANPTGPLCPQAGQRVVEGMGHDRLLNAEQIVGISEIEPVSAANLCDGQLVATPVSVLVRTSRQIFPHIPLFGCFLTLFCCFRTLCICS